MSGVKNLVQAKSKGLEAPTNEQLKAMGLGEEETETPEMEAKEMKEGTEGEEKGPTY